MRTSWTTWCGQRFPESDIGQGQGDVVDGSPPGFKWLSLLPGLDGQVTSRAERPARASPRAGRANELEKPGSPATPSPQVETALRLTRLLMGSWMNKAPDLAGNKPWACSGNKRVSFVKGKAVRSQFFRHGVYVKSP